MNAKTKIQVRGNTQKAQSKQKEQNENMKRFGKQPTMYYLITEWYKEEIASFLQTNEIQHRFIEVKENKSNKFKYSLLQSTRQLNKWGKTFASKLYEQYRNRDIQEQKQNQTLQEWLKHYEAQIEAQKNLVHIDAQEISFQQLEKMMDQGNVNVNLLNILIDNEISKKKQSLVLKLKEVKTKTYQTKNLIKQSKEECEEPSNKRSEILVKNLQLRLQAIAVKKRIDLTDVSQQSQKKVAEQAKKKPKIDDIQQELSRVKSVLKNGMWNCLSKIEQRLSKLDQTKNKVVSL